MNTVMNDNEIKKIEEVRRFLDGTSDMEFSIETKAERYDWIEKSFSRFRYLKRSKGDKGLILSYLKKVSGYSRIQIKRLARQYFETGRVRRRAPKKRGFPRKYTDTDIRLLAETDELHRTLSGHATKKICERACGIFGDRRYLPLVNISVSHIYNLRRSGAYRKVRRRFEKTRSRASLIGERRKPRPDGRPGYIRVDTVHQGDLDGIKGVYHINAVDEVTQIEIVCSAEKISENFLIPVLEEMISGFPFVVHGFHSDNGSEYINHRVAEMLNRLLIDLTKSRARHSNDNALAESKNGSIVRKHLGYVHIPQQYAQEINRFLRDFLNPYINFHRPCFFPETVTNEKGKETKRYPYNRMMTPYDKLKSLPDAERFLKPGLTFAELDKIAYNITDNEAARRMNEARNLLFTKINEQENHALKRKAR